GEGGAQEYRAPADASPLVNTPVDARHHLAAHAAVGDVDEEARAAIREINASGVDPAARPRGDETRCAVQVGGNPDGPPEVAAGAAREQGEHGVGADRRPLSIEEAVDDLVEGAVAAHDDDGAVPAGQSGANSPGGLARRFGDVQIEGHPRATQRRGGRRPVAMRAATGARRVHDQEGGRGHEGGEDRRAMSRVCSMSRAIAALSAAIELNARSERSRRTSASRTERPYRSPAKSSTCASTVTDPPPNVGRVPIPVAAVRHPSPKFNQP